MTAYPVRCLRCGYDLRETDILGLCPECGSPALPSVTRPPLMRYADRAWARDQEVGLWLATAAGVSAATLACVEVAAELGPDWLEAALTAAWVAAIGTAAAAAWRLGRPEPPAPGPSVRGRIARATLTPAVLLPAVRLIDAPTPAAPPWTWTLGTAAGLLAAAAGFAALLSLAADLCRRGEADVPAGAWSPALVPRWFLACASTAILLRSAQRLLFDLNHGFALAIACCPFGLALFIAAPAAVAVTLVAAVNLARIARGVRIERAQAEGAE